MWEWLKRLFGFGKKPAPPAPPAPPPPSTTHIHIHVRDGANQPIENAKVRLHIAHTGDVWAEGVSQGPEGYVMLTVPIGLKETQLQVFPPPEWLPVDRHVVVSPEVTIIEVLKPSAPKPSALPRVGIRGILFQVDGQTWRWKGVSAFTLYHQYLTGGDILPFCRFWVGQGANVLRVFGTLRWPDITIDPRQLPEYYSKLAGFAQVLNDAGLYLEFVPTADRLDGFDHFTHGQQTANALSASTNVFIEQTNEPTCVNPQTLDLATATVQTSLLRAAGYYNYDGTAPMTPAFDYITVHPARDAEWPRKIKDVMRELGVTGYQQTPALRRPIVNDEPIAAADYTRPGARSDDVRDFRDHAAVSAMFGAGATFHYEGGLRAQLPNAKEAECAAAFFIGLNAIPLDAPTWAYSAGHLGDCPLGQQTELRVYTMTSGDKGVGVVIRKGYTGSPPVKGGWQIVRSLTADSAIVELAR